MGASSPSKTIDFIAQIGPARAGWFKDPYLHASNGVGVCA